MADQTSLAAIHLASSFQNAAWTNPYGCAAPSVCKWEYEYEILIAWHRTIMLQLKKEGEDGTPRPWEHL